MAKARRNAGPLLYDSPFRGPVKSAQSAQMTLLYCYRAEFGRSRMINTEGGAKAPPDYKTPAVWFTCFPSRRAGLYTS